MDWLRAMSRLRDQEASGVLVTVVAVRGLAPRNPGAKMVVSAEKTWGSVGGGNLEESAIQRARKMLAEGATIPELSQSRLNERERTTHGRQCCGGVVELLLEPVPAHPPVPVHKTTPGGANQMARGDQGDGPWSSINGTP